MSRRARELVLRCKPEALDASNTTNRMPSTTPKLGHIIGHPNPEVRRKEYELLSALLESRINGGQKIKVDVNAPEATKRTKGAAQPLAPKKGKYQGQDVSYTPKDDSVKVAPRRDCKAKRQIPMCPATPSDDSGCNALSSSKCPSNLNISLQQNSCNTASKAVKTDYMLKEEAVISVLGKKECSQNEAAPNPNSDNSKTVPISSCSSVNFESVLKESTMPSAASKNILLENQSSSTCDSLSKVLLEPSTCNSAFNAVNSESRSKKSTVTSSAASNNIYSENECPSVCYLESKVSTAPSTFNSPPNARKSGSVPKEAETESTPKELAVISVLGNNIHSENESSPACDQVSKVSTAPSNFNSAFDAGKSRSVPEEAGTESTPKEFDVISVLGNNIHSENESSPACDLVSKVSTASNTFNSAFDAGKSRSVPKEAETESTPKEFDVISVLGNNIYLENECPTACDLESKVSRAPSNFNSAFDAGKSGSVPKEAGTESTPKEFDVISVLGNNIHSENESSPACDLVSKVSTASNTFNSAFDAGKSGSVPKEAETESTPKEFAVISVLGDNIHSENESSPACDVVSKVSTASSNFNSAFDAGRSGSVPKEAETESTTKELAVISVLGDNMFLEKESSLICDLVPNVFMEPSILNSALNVGKTGSIFKESAVISASSHIAPSHDESILSSILNIEGKNVPFIVVPSSPGDNLQTLDGQDCESSVFVDVIRDYDTIEIDGTVVTVTSSHDAVIDDLDLDGDLNESNNSANFNEFDLDGDHNNNRRNNSAKRKVNFPPEKGKLTSKRKSNPAEWKDNVNKIKYRSGQEYVNRKGVVVAAKEMGPGCKEACRYKCQQRVSLSTREYMHREFYKQSAFGPERAWDFVIRHVKKGPRAEITKDDSKRKCSYSYFFKINGREMKVCKTMFLSTLHISNTVIDSAFSKLGSGGSVSPSKKGKHSKVHIPEEVKASVRTHIEIFPKVEAHYVRKDSAREYLEHGVSVACMHRAYVKWMLDNATSSDPILDPLRYSQSLDKADESSGSDIEEDNEVNPEDLLAGNSDDEEGEDSEITDKTLKDKKIATLRQYRDIFRNEFNIGKHVPKKDQCDTCWTFRHASAEVKETMAQQMKDHHNLKDRIRMRLNSDREVCSSNGDKSVLFLCFDLQKVLYVPQGASSAFYYQSKLSVYNLTCFSEYMGKCKAYLFTWFETQAGKGANEVSSCVLKFFEIIRGELKDVKEIRSWSDNCPPQNKNRLIFAMMNLASLAFELKIIHSFLVMGHTQNPGDGVHARVETESRGKRLFVPAHWRKVMRDAKKKGEDYVVVKMDQSNIFNFRDLVCKQNWDKDTDGKKIKWLSVTEIKFEDGKTVDIQYDYNEASWVSLKVNQRIGRPVNLQNYLPPLAYDGLLGMTAQKKKCLLHLCKKIAVPKKYHLFFEAVCSMAPTLQPKKKGEEEDQT